MPPRARRRHVSRAETSLVCLIQALEGRKVVVELRNDSIIKGTVDAVDDYLNTTLSKVEFKTLDGNMIECEFMYLKGRNIRYVHLPKSLDPAKAIAAQRQKILDAKTEELKERLRNPLPRLQKGMGSQDLDEDKPELPGPSHQNPGL